VTRLEQLTAAQEVVASAAAAARALCTRIAREQEAVFTRSATTQRRKSSSRILERVFSGGNDGVAMVEEVEVKVPLRISRKKPHHQRRLDSQAAPMQGPCRLSAHDGWGFCGRCPAQPSPARRQQQQQWPQQEQGLPRASAPTCGKKLRGGSQGLRSHLKKEGGDGSVLGANAHDDSGVDMS